MPRPPLSAAGRAIVDAGIRQFELARALRVSDGTISRWLNGDAQPKGGLPPNFDAVLTALGGPDLTVEVRRLLDEQRREQDAEHQRDRRRTDLRQGDRRRRTVSR